MSKFEHSEKALEVFGENFSSKSRNMAILDFQMRLLDLSETETIPYVERFRFIKIVISNMEEFITVRLPRNPSTDVIEYISEIYHRMESIIHVLLSKEYVIFDDHIPYKAIKLNEIQYIYTGESSIDSFADIVQFVNDRNVMNDCALLVDHGHMFINDEIPFIFEVGSEIIHFDEIFDQINQKYQDNPEYYYPKHQSDHIDYRDVMDHDILIRTPYDSYDTVLEFIDAMCVSESITTIMISLYRVSSDSPIIQSLIKAKESGKDVYAYIEPTARGDEINNAKMIQILESHNVYVECRYMSYKVHSKLMCAIDQNGKVYAHIGTGNYNETTAKMYTDLHLLTSNQKTAVGVYLALKSLFNKSVPILRNTNIIVSPSSFRETLVRHIKSEILKGKNGRIFIKCNNMCDLDILYWLNQADKYGVDIRLIIRTACSVKLSGNVQIRSKVGQFLEHDRIYIFGDHVFISSADLLSRNISKRYESAVEIVDKEIKEKIKSVFMDVWNSDHIHTLCEDGWRLG